MTFRILIVDDEKNIRIGLAKALELEGYQISQSGDGKEALKTLTREDIDLIITDLRMPGLTGEELLQKVNSAYPTIPVIILTGHGTVDNAVQAMRDGAYDFLTKPVNLDRLSLLVKRALGRRELTRRHSELKNEITRLKKRRKNLEILGKSSPMEKVFELIDQVAPTRSGVLITGESGTGKELVANAIHAQSPRNQAPLVKVHCAALSQNLLESELFGHEKGAFTGAATLHKGRFERADGGTIFLDEIGEIDPSVQIKILRVLQEKSFERVGGERTITVDVRIIAATNRNLMEEVEAGNFREDLYYRLNVINIHVPPLRERPEDIPLLAVRFQQESSTENNKDILGIEPKALLALQNYPWPGNVRELRNIVESSVVMCRGTTITFEDLPGHITQKPDDATIRIPVGSSMENAEKIILRTTLAAMSGNKSKTADILGISRKTLHRKIIDYKLNDIDE